MATIIAFPRATPPQRTAANTGYAQLAALSARQARTLRTAGYDPESLAAQLRALAEKLDALSDTEDQS